MLILLQVSKKDSKEPLPLTKCVQFFQTENETWYNKFWAKEIRFSKELKYDGWVQLSISSGAKDFLKNQAYSRDVFEFSDSPESTLLKPIPYKTYERCLNRETARLQRVPEGHRILDFGKIPPHFGLELCLLKLKDWLEIVSAATEQTPQIDEQNSSKKNTPFELKMMSNKRDKHEWSGALSWVKKDELMSSPSFSFFGGSTSSKDFSKFRLADGHGAPYVMGVAMRTLFGQDLDDIDHWDRETDSWGYFEILDAEKVNGFSWPKRFVFREYTAKTEKFSENTQFFSETYVNGVKQKESPVAGEVLKERIDTFDLTLLEKPGYKCDRGLHGVRIHAYEISQDDSFIPKTLVGAIKKGMIELIEQVQDISLLLVEIVRLMLVRKRCMF